MRIYLDYNATSKVLPSVVDKIGTFVSMFGNPSSVYKEGRAVKALVEDTRRALAEDIGCNHEQIIFTSGATEANATILKSFMGRADVLVSGIEHASVRFAFDGMKILKVLPSGVVDVEALKQELATLVPGFLVSLMMVNNETGVIQPYAEVISLVHQYGGFVHIDAVQGYKKVDFSFADLEADFMTISGHKIGALKGAGAMIVKDIATVKALIGGGGQERYLRSGTENTLGIFSLGVAVKDDQAHWGHVACLRDEMEKRLQDIFPEITIFGAGVDRVGSCSCFSLASYSLPAQLQVIAMDQLGIAISSGSACSSGRVMNSHVLEAMGVSDLLASSAIRVSLGWDTTMEHIEKFVHMYSSFVERALKLK